MEMLIYFAVLTAIGVFVAVRNGLGGPGALAVLAVMAVPLVAGALYLRFERMRTK